MPPKCKKIHLHYYIHSTTSGGTCQYKSLYGRACCEERNRFEATCQRDHVKAMTKATADTYPYDRPIIMCQQSSVNGRYATKTITPLSIS